MRRHPDPPNKARRDATSTRGPVKSAGTVDQPAKPEFLVQGVNARSRAMASQVSSPSQTKRRGALRIRHRGALHKTGSIRGGPPLQNVPANGNGNQLVASDGVDRQESSRQILPSHDSYNSLSSGGQRRKPASSNRRLSQALCKQTCRSSRQLISVRHKTPSFANGNSSNNSQRTNALLKSPLPKLGKISAGRLSYVLVNIRKKHKEIEKNLIKLQRSARPSRSGGGVGMLISLPQLRSIDHSMGVLKHEFHELLSALVSNSDAPTNTTGTDNNETQDAEQTEQAKQATMEEDCKSDDFIGIMEESSPKRFLDGDSTAESSGLSHCPDDTSAEVCENEDVSQNRLSPDVERSSFETENSNVYPTQGLRISVHVLQPDWSSSAPASSDETRQSFESQTSPEASGFYDDASSFRSRKDRRSSTRLPPTERPLMPVSTAQLRADPAVSSDRENSSSSSGIGPAMPAENDIKSSVDEKENVRTTEAAISKPHPRDVPRRHSVRPQNSQQVFQNSVDSDLGPSGSQAARNPWGEVETRECVRRQENPIRAPGDSRAHASRSAQETGHDAPHRDPSKQQRIVSKASVSSMECVPASMHLQSADHQAPVTSRGQGPSRQTTLCTTTDADVAEGYKPSDATSKRRQAPPAGVVQPQPQRKATAREARETIRPQWFVDMNRSVTSFFSESDDKLPVPWRVKGRSDRPSSDVRRQGPPAEHVQTKSSNVDTATETKNDAYPRQFDDTNRSVESTTSTSSAAAPVCSLGGPPRDTQRNAPPAEDVQTYFRSRDTTTDVRKAAPQPQWFADMNRSVASTASKNDAFTPVRKHGRENVDRSSGDVRDNSCANAQQRSTCKQSSKSKIPHWLCNVHEFLPSRAADAAVAVGGDVHGAIQSDDCGRHAAEFGGGSGIVGPDCRGRRRNLGDNYCAAGGVGGSRTGHYKCRRCSGDVGVSGASGAGVANGVGGDNLTSGKRNCSGRQGDDNAGNTLNGRDVDGARRGNVRAGRGNAEDTADPPATFALRHRPDNFISPPETSRNRPRAEASDRPTEISSTFTTVGVPLPPWLQDNARQRSKSSDNPRESLDESRERYRRTLITVQNAALTSERASQNDRMTPSWLLELRRANSPHGNVNGSNVAQTQGDLCLPPISDNNSVSSSICRGHFPGHAKVEQMTKATSMDQNDVHTPSLKGSDDKSNSTSLSFEARAEIMYEEEDRDNSNPYSVDSGVSGASDPSRQLHESEMATSSSARRQRGSSEVGNLFSFLRDSGPPEYRVARVTIHEIHSQNHPSDCEAENRDTRSATAHVDFHDHQIIIPSNGFLVDRLGTPELLPFSPHAEVQMKTSLRHGTYTHLEDDALSRNQGLNPISVESSSEISSRNGVYAAVGDYSVNARSSAAFEDGDETYAADDESGAETYRNAAHSQFVDIAELNWPIGERLETAGPVVGDQPQCPDSLSNYVVTPDDGRNGQKSNNT